MSTVEVLPNRLAERATLLALRAAQRDTSREIPQEYVVLPSANHLTYDQALDALARVNKPAICSAVLLEGRLVLNCRELTTPTDMQNQKVWFDTMISSDIQRITQRAAGVPNPTIVLQGYAEERVPMSLEEYKQWMYAYHPGGLDVAVGDADADAMARGAVAIVRFSPPSELRSRLFWLPS